MNPSSSTSKPVISPIAGLFIGILSVSTASLFIRFAQVEVPSIVIAAGRMTLASLFLAPFVLVQKSHELRKIDKKTWLLLGLAGLFLGFHFATWITSLEYTTVASSVVLVTTAPLWVALLSPVFLKESINRWVLLGLVISLGGSVIVGLSGNCQIIQGNITCSGFEGMFSGRHFGGNLLALGGAFLSGGYLMVGRKVRNSLDLSVYTFVVYGFAAIVLIIMVIITGSKISGYSSINYIWILSLAVVPQLIGHSAFNWALKYLSAAFVSIALLGEPVGTVILAYFFLAEKPSVLEVVGGLLILSGIFIATRKKKIEPGNEEDLL